jgi:hypothetical protein
LHAALTGPQRLALDALLAVPPGARASELERWRTGPARASGPQMVRALNRVAEIIGPGLSRVQLDASVTPRRLAELARYGMGKELRSQGYPVRDEDVARLSPNESAGLGGVR